MLQYNGELELKDTSKEGYIITGFQNLLTEDVSDITRFNVNGAIGLTAGYGRFKIKGTVHLRFYKYIEPPQQSRS